MESSPIISASETKMDVGYSSEKPPLDPFDSQIFDSFLKNSKKMPKLQEYFISLNSSKDYLKAREILRAMKKNDTTTITKRTFLESWKLFEQFDKAYALLSSNTIKTVLDLGSSPGGYSQYILDRIGVHNKFNNPF